MSSANQLDPQTAAPVLAAHLGLVDAVDHLLNRGAVVTGDAAISLAGVDLVYVSLSLLVSSVDTLRQSVGSPGTPSFRVQPASDGPANGPRIGPAAVEDVAKTPALPRDGEGEAGGDVSLSPTPDHPRPTEAGASVPDDDPSRSLARLILTLVEMLRQILERQALRRVEGGSLSEDVVEQLGVALLDLETKMAELRRIFALSEEELNIDLGPLGKLL